MFAAAGRVAGVQRKRHLGEGEEAFTPAAGSAVFEHAGTRFGVAICAEAGFDAPFDAAAAADEDFPGLAALVRPDGGVAARLPDWRPGVLTVDIPL